MKAKFARAFPELLEEALVLHRSASMERTPSFCHGWAPARGSPSKDRSSPLSLGVNPRTSPQGVRQ